MNISVCIIVKNAKDTIGECLDSVRDFDEVVLLDNGSSDTTLEIARNFSNVKIYESEFIGFGALKNLAISYAKNDYILSLDSDEVLESKTLECIKNIELDTHTIYALPRKNLYNGTWIKACGWYPDFVYRIFNKTHTRFNENIVHESVILHKDSVIKRLDCGIRHYAYDNIEHLVAKMQIYSTLWAEQNSHKKSSISKAILHSLWSFLLSYFFKKGFLYGYEGFIISICNALGVFFKYAKLYENTMKPPPYIPSCSLIVTTYNQKERLKLVLDSIKSLNPMPCEVLVADDGSTEDTRLLIEVYARDFPVPLRHIYQEDKGFRLSQIRNKALKAANGEYIIIIDGDMVLESHFVSDHLRFAKKGAFLQGSRVILGESDTDRILDSMDFALAYKFGGFKAKRCKILADFIYRNSCIKSSIFDKRDLIKGIRGCNMSFFKSDCLGINGFNEDFIGWGREDSEFVARFLFGGGELRRVKFGAIAYHLYHEENPRSMLPSNHQIYLDTIKNKSKFAKNGINKCK